MNCDQSNVLSASWLKRASLAIVSTVFFTVVMGGCTDSTSNRQSDFVVVDVISVARALGRDEIIQQKLEEAKTLLNVQLIQISTSLQQQLREEQSRLDESKNQSDQEKINNLTYQTQLKLKQSQLLAQQKAEQFRSRLLLDFREEVLAVAGDIAKGRRALSIQIANNDLLWVDPSVDITAEVIKVLRASENRVESTVAEKKPETESQTDSTAEQKTSENSEQIHELNQLIDTIANEDKPKPLEHENESRNITDK